MTGLTIVLTGLILLQSPGVDHHSCANQVIGEFPAPDGRLVAVLFVRGCGDPPRFGTQIALLKPGRPPSNVPGNLFLSEGHLGLLGSDAEPVIAVRWTAPDRLLVRHAADVSVITAKKKLKGVTVTYETGPIPHAVDP